MVKALRLTSEFLVLRSSVVFASGHAEAGRIHGLRNPDGLWLFSEAHIEHARYERLMQ